ncbi:MAG: DUF4372 domain-containing protein [Acidobacteriota bacterium]
MLRDIIREEGHRRRDSSIQHFQPVVAVAFAHRASGHGREHKAEHHARGFTCWDQFVAMLFCQLAGAQSLREICGPRLLPGVYAAGCVKRPAEVAASIRDATGAALKAMCNRTSGAGHE